MGLRNRKITRILGTGDEGFTEAVKKQLESYPLPKKNKGGFSNERQVILRKRPNGEFYWEEAPFLEERIIGHLGEQTNPGLLEAIRTGKMSGDFKEKTGEELWELIKKANSKKSSH